MFKTDGGGLALQISDAKLSTSCSASTWSTRLSQIGRISGKITICTYSLPSMDYLRKVFDKRSDNTLLIVNSKFLSKAQSLQALYPSLTICLKEDVHAKFVLIEPDTVWLSSANMGRSGWFEQTIGMHSKEAYNYMMSQVEIYLKEGK